MTTSDDDKALRPVAADLEALGTIRVDICRVICHGSTTTGTFIGRNCDQLDNPRSLHEKTKKAGAHRVQFVSRTVVSILNPAPD